MILVPKIPTQEHSKLLFQKKQLQRLGFYNLKQLFNSKLQVFPFWLSQQQQSNQLLKTPNTFQLLNTEYRSWTTLCYPNSNWLSNIDSRGLLCPGINNFSIDVWFEINETLIFPSQNSQTIQTIEASKHNLTTFFSFDDIEASISVSFNLSQTVLLESNISLTSFKKSYPNAKIHLTIRPYNLEGFFNISHILYLQKQCFLVNHQPALYFKQKPSNILCIDGSKHDLTEHIGKWDYIFQATSQKGLCTAAASFELKLNKNQAAYLDFYIPQQQLHRKTSHRKFVISQLNKTLYYLRKNSPLISTKAIEHQLSSYKYWNKPLQELIEQSLYYLLQNSSQNLPLIYNQAHCYMLLVDSLVKTPLHNTLNQTLKKFYQNVYHPIFGCSLLEKLYLCNSYFIIQNYRKDANFITAKKRLLKSCLKQLKQNSKKLNRILKDYCFTHSKLVLQEKHLDLLFQATFFIQEFKKHKSLSQALTKPMQEFLQTNNYSTYIKNIDFKFIQQHYLKQTQSQAASSSLLIAALILNLFNPEQCKTIYQIYKKQCLSNGLFMLHSWQSGISSCLSLQIAQLSELPVHKNPHFKSCLTLFETTGSCPTLCSLDTLKGCAGIGHDYMANALFLSTLYKNTALYYDQALHLFKGLELPNKNGKILELKSFYTCAGSLSLMLKKENQKLILSIELDTEAPCPAYLYENGQILHSKPIILKKQLQHFEFVLSNKQIHALT